MLCWLGGRSDQLPSAALQAGRCWRSSEVSVLNPSVLSAPSGDPESSEQFLPGLTGRTRLQAQASSEKQR